MASLTIRNFDDDLKVLLRLRAAHHGCSMEQEARDILRNAVQPATAAVGFAQRIHQRFTGLAVDDLPIPKRQRVRLLTVPGK